jgi:two-component system, OmpR family, phosphate regulon sensor histidine kinase PhoR
VRPALPATTISRWWQRSPSAPPRIAAAYAILSITWIAFSDRALSAFVPDPRHWQLAQTLKGALFVVVTSALLFLLIRRSERGLKALGSEVRATFDSMADAVLVVDADRRIVEANRAALALFGVASKDELLGPLEAWGRRFELRGPDGSPMALDRYASVRALSGELHARYDGVIRSADGKDVFVSVSSSPVERAGGASLAVTILRDVSAARRLDEIREEFLSTAAHEFKTPLAVIKAYSQLMERREPDEAQALSVIQRQVDRLTRLVQHLLDTSRLRLDGSEGRRERFDLGALAAEVVDRMRPAAPAHELRLEARPAFVLADRDRIGRVLTSLLDNAVRFSPDGGPVEARVEADDGVVTVSIRDRGLGIAPERQAHLFERYYRAHAGTPVDYGGLGLGLEVSREIVRRHGGRMWFESAPGVGSTFRFSLPLAAGALA